MPDSRKIGNRNEREVVKFFKRWTGWDFHKVPASGGLHWKKDYRVSGDIVCPEEKAKLFPFSVEAKTRRKKVSKKRKLVRDQINVGDLLLNWHDSPLYEFWEQCDRDALSVKREPIMFLRNSGMRKGLFYVFMYEPLAVALEKEFGIPFMHIPQLYISVTSTEDLIEEDHLDLFRFVRKCRKKLRETVVGG
jgi:hypothetical protein